MFPLPCFSFSLVSPYRLLSPCPLLGISAAISLQLQVSLLTLKGKYNSFPKMHEIQREKGFFLLKKLPAR